ncbi:MAG: MFS transporter [Desulfosarcinaceae bacterium]
MKAENFSDSPNHDGGVQGELNEDSAERSMPLALVLLLAVATGASVASLYYAQPLLEAIRDTLGMDVAGAGLIVTASQLGYAIGLVFLVPLGDLIERRKLVVIMTIGIAVGLAGIGFSPDGPTLILLSVGVGALSAVAQVLVAFSADLAGPAERGRVVGAVMSGLLIGVLLARTVAGILAQVYGWRAVFWFAAGGMMLIALSMYRGLPLRTPNVKLGYLALIRSTTALFKNEPVLRLRSLYGAIAFGVFSALWTPLAFLLSKPPFNYSPGIIGLFGLAGIAGATASSVAGRLADRGAGRRVTFTAIFLLTASWLLIWSGRHSVLLLIAGIVLVDIGVFALQITNQSEIYRLHPEARSRLTSAYMSCFFAGGVIGSSASSLVYAGNGWAGVCLLGAAFGLLAGVVWIIKNARTFKHRTNFFGAQTCDNRGK